MSNKNQEITDSCLLLVNKQRKTTSATREGREIHLIFTGSSCFPSSSPDRVWVVEKPDRVRVVDEMIIMEYVCIYIYIYIV